MNIETKVAGITFVNKDPVFKKLRPSGLLELRPDPTNKFDKNGLAVEVWMQHEGEAVRIGFLPAKIDGSPELDEQCVKLQQWVHDQVEQSGEVVCCVLDYSYWDDDIKYNEDHKGKLQSVRMYVGDNIVSARTYYKAYQDRKAKRKEYEAEQSKGETGVHVNSTHYLVSQGDKKPALSFRRITDLLGCYEADGKEGFDRIIKWAMEQGFNGLIPSAIDLTIKDTDTKALAERLFKEYRKAFEKTGVDGTDHHNNIEQWLIAHASGKPTKDIPVPEGFLNWHKKWNPVLIATETTVYDHDLMVAGTFDAKFKINPPKGDEIVVAVDWKSSKAVRKKHKMQVGFYGYIEDADEAWVVALGADNKQKYSLTKLTRESCINAYDKISLLVQLQNLEV